MATTEERVDKLEIKFATLSEQFAATMAKVDMLVSEMRDRDNRRATEISELRHRQDADRKALESKIDRLGDKIQNIVVAAVVGFGAIALAVGGLVVAAFK